jgi:hypothetical protein
MLYGLEHLPVYNPLELDWQGLPERCAMMTHWHRSEPLASLLEQERFRVVTLVRHPLDSLNSILHYAPHHPETSRWLDGEGGDERAIVGATPRSPRFLDYVEGARARALLSISHEWTKAPGAIAIRYEDLVRDTPGTLRRLTSEIGSAPRVPFDEVIAAHTLERMRAREGPHHWQGRPGLWKELLPAREARRIAAAHKTLLRDYGYACDPDEALSDKQADARWDELILRRIQQSQPS